MIHDTQNMNKIPQKISKKNIIFKFSICQRQFLSVLVLSFGLDIFELLKNTPERLVKQKRRKN